MGVIILPLLVFNIFNATTTNNTTNENNENVVKFKKLKSQNDIMQHSDSRQSDKLCRSKFYNVLCLKAYIL